MQADDKTFDKKVYPYVKEILLSEKQIEAKCKELGAIISKDYEGKTPLLVGLLKGSVPFMAELMKNITIPINIDFIVVKSYAGTQSTGKVEIYKEPHIELKDRDIIIVEDIVDTGFTLSEVLKIFKERGAKSVEIVCMIDKKERRKVELTPKYIGFDIPSGFLIGYGLDYNQLYRNLPFVGVIADEYI